MQPPTIPQLEAAITELSQTAQGRRVLVAYRQLQAQAQRLDTANTALLYTLMRSTVSHHFNGTMSALLSPYKD